MRSILLSCILAGLVPGVFVGLGANERFVAARVALVLLLLSSYLFGALGWGQPRDVRREPDARLSAYGRSALWACGVVAGFFAGRWIIATFHPFASS